jgi:sialate O-acetylesterase
MEMPVKGFKNTPVLESGETILNSQNKNIRLFNVPRSTQLAAQDTCKANHWNEASPEVVCNFSATGYFFGKLLNQFLNIPVGLICSSYGGSPVEAFMSKETLTPFKKDIRIPDENARVNNRTSTAIFNGMIHPIIGYSIKGCIWYQGESNYDKPDLYKQLFPAMVKEWRTEWDIGEFPFYFVQIAPFDYAQLPPYNSGGKYNSAYIRDAQRKCLSLIPNSGMAVIMDLGEEQNIHPRHKQEVGKRLALLALGNTYGRKGFEYASPLYDSLHMEGSTVTVHFKNTPNGLTSFGKEISTFEIAGNDKVFHAAKAVIINSGVILSSPEVKQPVAVRYAFKDFVVGDLFSTEGLPVSSFSTEEGN